MRLRKSSRTRCTVRSLMPSRSPMSLLDSPSAFISRIERFSSGTKLAKPAEDLVCLRDLAGRVDRIGHVLGATAVDPEGLLSVHVVLATGRRGDIHRSLYSSQPAPGRRQDAANLRIPSVPCACGGRSCPRRSGGNRASRTGSATAVATAGAPPGEPRPRTAAAARERLPHLPPESASRNRKARRLRARGRSPTDIVKPPRCDRAPDQPGGSTRP